MLYRGLIWHSEKKRQELISSKTGDAKGGVNDAEYIMIEGSNSAT